MVDPEVGEHGRAVAQRSDVLDVGAVLEPEDLASSARGTRPTRSLSSREVIAQPPPAGPRAADAVLLDERVLVRTDVVAPAARPRRAGRPRGRRRGSRRRAAARRRRAASRPSPAARSRRRRRARPGREAVVSRKARAYPFWPMFVSLRMTRIRGSSSDREYSAVPSVDPLSQITISRVASDVRSSTFSTHLRSRSTRLCVSTTIAMPPSAGTERCTIANRSNGPGRVHAFRLVCASEARTLDPRLMDRQAETTIGVVIRTLNEAELIGTCLETLGRQRTALRARRARRGQRLDGRDARRSRGRAAPGSSSCRPATSTTRSRSTTASSRCAAISCSSSPRTPFRSTSTGSRG